MEKTQKALRLHIALLGRVNSGKSSFLNLVAGQDISITSEIAGTTTDVVEKTQELIPLGPVVWLDTAGFGDETKLGRERMARSLKSLDKADVAVLVCEGGEIGDVERQIIQEVEKRALPLIKVYNKADKFHITQTDGIVVNSTDKSSRDKVLNMFKAELIKKAPEETFAAPSIIGDLVKEHSNVVLVIPLDDQAPKGRLLPLQVHVIRDCLDKGCTVTSVKESEYAEALSRFKNKPDLVITDSSVVDMVNRLTPLDVPLTTFSILFARLKGDLFKLVEGVKVVRKLQDGDKVLVAESCTHHAIEDDIGTVKIPNWLRKKTGADLQIDHVSGCDFPNNLGEYKLVIQCGGCMNNRKEILSRINKCEQAHVAVTNYGVCISALKGVLNRVLEPFDLK